MKRMRILSTVALVAAMGCGPEEKTPNAGNSANPNSNPNSVFTPNNGSGEDVAKRLWETICDAAFNCGNVNGELLSVVGRYRTEGDCRAASFPGLAFDTAQIDASVAAGRASWNSSKAEACFASLRDSLCNGGGTFEGGPECDEVVVGLVAEDGACATDEECADDRHCRSEEDTCFGTCVPNCGTQNCGRDEYCDFTAESDTCAPLGGVGASCTWSGECGRGLGCGDEETCEQRETSGSPQLLNAGDACSLSGGEVAAYCKAGLVCTNLMLDASMTSLTGTCSPPQMVGGACRLALECEAGLTCTATSPLEPGTCVAAAADGAACDDALDCLSYYCDNGTGTCSTGSSDPVCELP